MPTALLDPDLPSLNVMGGNVTGECDWTVGSEMVFGSPGDETVFLKMALPFHDSGCH